MFLASKIQLWNGSSHAELAGKQVTAGNIAYYTILHMKSGRRSTGHSNADVLGTATQLNGRSSLYSFDEPVERDGCFCVWMLMETSEGKIGHEGAARVVPGYSGKDWAAEIGNGVIKMKVETQQSHENNARKRCLRIR